MDIPEARSTAMGEKIQEWATERLLVAREAYQDPATGRMIKPDAKLGNTYQARSLPVAKRRFYQAGARLAWVLNDMFNTN